MRRMLLVGLVLLASCGSDAPSGPSAVEKQQRGITLAAALLHRTIAPSVAAAAELECSFDSSARVRDYQVDGFKRQGMDADSIVRQMVVVDLSACPKGRWDDIASALAATGVATRADVASVVAEGRSALDG